MAGSEVLGSIRSSIYFPFDCDILVEARLGCSSECKGCIDFSATYQESPGSMEITYGATTLPKNNTMSVSVTLGDTFRFKQ
jgi:hypothetical protein